MHMNIVQSTYLTFPGGAQGLCALPEEVPLAVVAVPGQAARHPEERAQEEAAGGRFGGGGGGREGRHVQLQHLRQRLLHPLLAEGAQEQALGHTGGKSIGNWNGHLIMSTIFTCGSRSKNGKFSSFLIQRIIRSILRLRMLKVFKAKMF